MSPNRDHKSDLATNIDKATVRKELLENGEVSTTDSEKWARVREQARAEQTISGWHWNVCALISLLRRIFYTFVILEVIGFEWLVVFGSWVLEQANRKGWTQVVEFRLWCSRRADPARVESSDTAVKDEFLRHTAQATPADFEEPAATQRAKKENAKDKGGNQKELATRDRYQKDSWNNSDWKEKNGWKDGWQKKPSWGYGKWNNSGWNDDWDPKDAGDAGEGGNDGGSSSSSASAGSSTDTSGGPGKGKGRKSKKGKGNK